KSPSLAQYSEVLPTSVFMAQLSARKVAGHRLAMGKRYGRLLPSVMSVLRSLPALCWLSCTALVVGCATPIREDPPSKLGSSQSDTAGTEASGGSTASLTANGSTSVSS